MTSNENKYFGDSFVKTFLPNIASSFTKHQLKKSTAKSLIKLGPIFIVCLVVMQQSYQKNVERIREIDKVLKSHTAGEYIKHFTRIQKELNQQPWYSRLYFFSLANKSLNNALSKAITCYVKTNIAPILVIFLKDQINQNLRKVDILVEAFKVYLMLYGLEPVNLYYIKNWYDKQIDKISSSYEIDKQILEEILRVTDLDILKQEEFDEELYLKVTSELSNYSISQAIHDTIKNKLTSEPEINFSDIVSKKLLSILDAKILTIRIPHIFTQKGYAKYFRYKVKILKDILSVTYLRKNLGLEDFKHFTEEINNLYEEEYLGNWQEVWSNIRFKKVSSIDEALKILKNISLNLPLIFKFLQQIDKKLFLIKSSEAIEKGSEIADKVSGVMGALSPFSEEIEGFIKYRPLDKNAILAAEEKLKEIEGLTKLIASISFSSNREEACFEAMKKFETAEDSQLKKAEEIFYTLPAPLDRIYGTLIRSIKLLLYQYAAKYINHNWQEKVYKFYVERIKNKYPFSGANYNQPLPINDFAKFFGKGGILDTFISHYLSLKDLVLSQKDKELFQVLEQIKTNWFNSDGEPQVQLNFTPIRMDGRLKKVVLSMLGNEAIFTHDKFSPCAFIWPSKTPVTHHLKVQFIDNKNKSTLAYMGPWTIYKLLELSFQQAVASTISLEGLQGTIKSPLGDLEYLITFGTPLPLFDKGKIVLPENIVEITKNMPGIYEY